MGLFSFIKDAGAYLFGAAAGNAVAKEQAQPVNADILKQQIDTLGISVDNLQLAWNDPTAIVGGTVASHSDKEKVVLGIGNTPGVGEVDDQLQVAQGAAAAAGAASTFYTVKKGDNLSGISKAHYGTPNKYNQIFEANKPMLKHPDKIFPGQVLRIPPA
jgi:nucleoid-associated protein YgaU